MGASAKKTNDLLDKSRQTADAGYAAANSRNTSRSDTAYSQAQGDRQGLQDRFAGYADTGGIDPADADRLRSTFGSSSAGGYGGSGGSSVANELASTGGIDESAFTSALKGYSDFAAGNGIDSQAMLARANSVLPSFYKNLANNNARRQMVNPYGPSYDASTASMARQAGQQTQEAERDNELSVADAGAKYKEFGIQGLGNLNTSIQGMKQQGKIAGGSQQISNGNLGLGYAQLNESAAARRQSGEENLLGLKQSGKIQGLGGLSDMYNSDQAYGRGYNQDATGTYGAQENAATNNINSRQDPSKWWKDLTKQALSATAGVFTGGASLAIQAAMKKRQAAQGGMG